MLQVKSVKDPAFKPYGHIVEGVECQAILETMKHTPIPEGVVYEASAAELEEAEGAKEICLSLYGGMPIQIGYCNGHNKKLNAVEYHRDSEVNIAGTDLVLILGRQQDIEADGSYDTQLMEAFLVPAGTIIEVYATTLHYAPCHVTDNGFQCVVVLPKGTNTDKEAMKILTAEDKLLFAKNKWLIAHEESGLEQDGAYIGLKGENLSIQNKYKSIIF